MPLIVGTESELPPPPTPTPTPTPPPPNDLLITGSSTMVRNLEVKVVEHKVVDKVGRYYAARGNKMTVLFVDVTNHGSRGDRIYLSQDLLIRDLWGDVWRPNASSAQYAAEEQYNLGASYSWIVPGQTLRLVFVWVLPNAVTGLTLEART